MKKLEKRLGQKWVLTAFPPDKQGVVRGEVYNAKDDALYHCHLEVFRVGAKTPVGRKIRFREDYWSEDVKYYVFEELDFLLCRMWRKYHKYHKSA